MASSSARNAAPVVELAMKYPGIRAARIAESQYNPVSFRVKPGIMSASLVEDSHGISGTRANRGPYPLDGIRARA